MGPPNPIQWGEFKCEGHGLTFNSHRRASTITLKQAVGLSNRRQKHHPPDWWKAQTKLYGLQSNGDCPKNYKDAFLAAFQVTGGKGISVPLEMKKVEERLNKEYNELYSTWRIKEAEEAEKRRIDILGQWEATRELREEEARNSENEWRRRENSFELPEIQVRLSEIDRKHKSCLRKGFGGYISGKWEFAIPGMEGYRSDLRDGPSEIIWNMYPPLAEEGCIWVSFEDWMFTNGVMKIQWPAGDWKEKELKFTWRGREGSTGEIQFLDEENNGTITFHSTNECSGTFKCAFGGPWQFRGKKIDGRDLQTEESLEDCKSDFKRFNERRHARESVTRWGGWGRYSDEDEESEPAEDKEDYGWRSVF